MTTSPPVGDVTPTRVSPPEMFIVPWPVVVPPKMMFAATLIRPAVCVIVPLIVIGKHHANIRRLLTGTEYRFGKTKAAAA